MVVTTSSVLFVLLACLALVVDLLLSHFFSCEPLALYLFNELFQQVESVEVCIRRDSSCILCRFEI